MADLLTHTAAVDDHMVGAESPIKRPIDLGSYFRTQLPVLVRKPGVEIDHSNHGVALAAHVVECVSGMRFYEYAEQRILGPLDMRHSTFRQPLPEALRRNVGFERFEKPYTIPYPVATLVTTPVDMARFILAHLKAAPFRGRILNDNSLDLMHAQHFAPSPNLPGIGYGFFEAWDAGGRALFHAGARDHFSLLYLVPERRFGMYIAMCGASEQSQSLPQVVRAFLGHLFGPADTRIPRARPSAIPEWLPGRYRLDAISHSTLEKLVGLGAEIRVKQAGADIDVTLPSFSHGESMERYLQIAPLLFRSHSGALLEFRKDSETKAFRSDFVSDPMSLTRVPWYESSPVFLATIAVAYVIFASFLTFSVYWATRRGCPELR